METKPKNYWSDKFKSLEIGQEFTTERTHHPSLVTVRDRQKHKGRNYSVTIDKTNDKMVIVKRIG